MALRESFLHARDAVGEGTHWYYTTTLPDKLGVPITSANLATLTLTLINPKTTPATIVNGRDHVDIKGVNGGTLTPQGVLSLTLSGGDTAFLQSGPGPEMRRARLEWVKVGSGDVAWKEIDFVLVRKTAGSL